MVPVLLGFQPAPEYVEFNILWIAYKATKFWLIREGTGSALPHVFLFSGLISLHINCGNFFQQGKHELAFGGKKTKPEPSSPCFSSACY